MRNYLDLLEKVYFNGSERMDRTGTGTRSLFSEKLDFDLRKGFPLMTTKYVNFRAIVLELLWFLRGETNVSTLDTKIWDEWADPLGGLGPIYGQQWRSWRAIDGTAIDQIAQVIQTLTNDPASRRMVVSAWNTAVLPAKGIAPKNPALGRMALAPCHCLFQFYVDGEYLSCQMYQRSADLFLGVPFNIASYALLTHMMAAAVSLRPGNLHVVFGDVHIYKNHMTPTIVDKQLARTPGSFLLTIDKPQPDPANYTTDEILEGLTQYRPQSSIKAPISK